MSNLKIAVDLIGEAEKIIEGHSPRLEFFRAEWLMLELNIKGFVCTLQDIGPLLTELIKRGKLTIDIGNKECGDGRLFTPENYLLFIVIHS